MKLFTTVYTWTFLPKLSGTLWVKVQARPLSAESLYFPCHLQTSYWYKLHVIHQASPLVFLLLYKIQWKYLFLVIGQILSIYMNKLFLHAVQIFFPNNFTSVRCIRSPFSQASFLCFISRFSFAGQLSFPSLSNVTSTLPL